MRLIIGLGNPGDKYDHTRHNVGFDVLTLLSGKLDIPIKHLRNRSLVGEGFCRGQKVALCKPQTYMNLSGEAVAELMRWYKLSPENLLVIYDDIDLAPGWLRIRPNGSAGTHNGMRSIVACVNGENFPRVRIGVGNDGEGDLKRYVLGKPGKGEQLELATAFQDAADAVRLILEGKLSEAQAQYNKKHIGSSSSARE